jgi:DNA primase
MAKQVLGDYDLPEEGDIIDIVTKKQETLAEKEKREKLILPLMRLEKAIIKNEPDNGKNSSQVRVMGNGCEKQNPTPDPAPGEKLTISKKNKHEIVLTIDDRTYQLSRFSLKVLNDFSLTLKITQGGRFFLSEVNLAKSSGRSLFAREVKEALSISEEVIKDDLFLIMEKLETLQREYISTKEGEMYEGNVFTMSREEEWEARKILGERDVLTTDLVKDMERIGLVGEEINKYAWYLAITSRITNNPFHILSLGQSGVGKSYGQEMMLNCAPDEDVKRYSRMTPQAFYYYGRSGLKHKIVAIDEIEGMIDTMYALRTFLSNGYLTNAYPKTDPRTGQMTTVERRVDGPIVVFLTSTSLDLIDYETKSRFLVTGSDETKTQTKSILKKQYDTAAKPREDSYREYIQIIRKYKSIQKVLLPIEVRMPESWKKKVNPHGERLGTRRMNKTYMAVIAAITTHRQLLYEKQKGKNGKPFLYMQKGDVELANRICKVLFENTIGDLLPPVKTLLFAVRELCVKKSRTSGLPVEEITFTKVEAMEAANMSEWHTRKYMLELIRLEYVGVLSGKKGRRYVYCLLNPGRVMGACDFDFFDPEKL